MWHIYSRYKRFFRLNIFNKRDLSLRKKVCAYFSLFLLFISQEHVAYFKKEYDMFHVHFCKIWQIDGFF